MFYVYILGRNKIKKVLSKKLKIIICILEISITLFLCLFIVSEIKYKDWKSNPTYSPDTLYQLSNNYLFYDEDIKIEISDKPITQEEMIEYLELLKDKGKIVDYSYGSSGVVIYCSGGGVMVCNRYNPSMESADSLSVTALQNKSVISNEEAELSVLTCQPYADDGEFKTDIFDNSAVLIEESNLGYKFTDNIDNEDVTVDFMKNLAKYRVVIFDGHGVITNENEFYGIALGEKATAEKDKNKYKYEIKNGLVGWLKDGRYFITPAFFEHYYEENSLNNTLFYFGCCEAGNDESQLSKILISKGSEAVLAYKNSVYPAYSRSMCETICNELVKNDGNGNSTKTIAEALEIAKKENGATDPNHIGWRYWLYDLLHEKEDKQYNKKEDRAELILKENDDVSFRLFDENVIEPTEQDFQMFEDMLNKTISTWIIDKTIINFNSLSSEELMTYFICDFSETSIYTYFWKDDFVEKDDECGIWLELNADKADWIIENVFCGKINRDLKSDHFYYKDNKLNVFCTYGGTGAYYVYKVIDKCKLDDNKYGLSVVFYDDTEYNFAAARAYYFVVSLQNDKTIGKYWRIHILSNEKCFEEKASWTFFQRI